MGAQISEETILSTMRLGEALASKLVRNGINLGLDIDDATSSAYLGLTRALETFDDSKGVPFPCYAYIRMRGAVLDYIRSEEQQIGLCTKGRQRSKCRKEYRAGEAIECLGMNVVAAGSKDQDLIYRSDYESEDFGDWLDRRRLPEFLEQLQPIKKQVVELYYLEEQSLDQIAKRGTHKCKSSVMRDLHRAVGELQQLMAA